MKKREVFREITPLSPENCFILIDRVKTEFNYPVHVHGEYELNFVEGAAGAQRIMGDSIEEIGDVDLVLVTNPELEHAWLNHNNRPSNIREITIQFHPDFIDEKLLHRTQFKSINMMFETAQKGLAFSPETIAEVRPLLENLCNTKGFYSILELLEILHLLSVARDSRTLSSSVFTEKEDTNDSRRITRVTEYLNNNYDKTIKLSDVAALINMSEVAFCRFFRRRTSKTPIEYLNDIRIAMATKQLVDTAKPISEICYQSGFNNLSNFNRCFLKKKGCTPTEFRKKFAHTRQII